MVETSTKECVDGGGEVNDHRTVFFVNRSREWVELKGTLKMGENREMTSTARIPPKATYVHQLLGNNSDKMKTLKRLQISPKANFDLHQRSKSNIGIIVVLLQ